MQVSINNNVVAIQTAYSQKDRCTAIPGGRWNPQNKTWDYMLSPATASTMLQVWGKSFPDEARPLFEDLASRLVMAQAVKNEVVDLIVPKGKMAPWRHQLIAYNMAIQLFGLRDPYGLPLENFGGGALLALDMGCGKSRVTVDLISNHQRQLRKNLIVCPHSVVPVWTGSDTRPGQFDIHALHEDRKCMEIVRLDSGSLEKKTQIAQQAFTRAERYGRQFICVINYESVWREPFASWALKLGWDLGAGDEIHRIKSPGGKASKFFDKLARKAKCRLGLSGTPLPHSPVDVYGQYRFLDPGIFGTSFGNFRSDYCVMGGFQGHQVLNFKNLDQLQAKMYLIAYRVMSDDVFDLPEFVDSYKEFDLSSHERKIYDEMDQEFCVQVKDDIITADNAMVKLLRLQQVTSGHIDGIPVGDSKKKILADTLEDLPIKEPVVVFARFTADLQAVREVCQEQGRSYAELSGESKELEIWQNGGADILGVQIQSGKEGVDFTRARYNIYFSLGYSLGDYNQSRKRSRRPGQNQSGFYIHLVASRSVDSKIIKALENKEEIVESVLRQYKDS
ncbi:MAG: hypothetical protein CSYNP_03534 [Syntrophus sp. SKADARSKE-3]|nr:hypothetical protein [Syntrophus sp. SKADARSKE-3]